MSDPTRGFLIRLSMQIEASQKIPQIWGGAKSPKNMGNFKLDEAAAYDPNSARGTIHGAPQIRHNHRISAAQPNCKWQETKEIYGG